MEARDVQFRISDIEISRSSTNDKIVGFFRFENPSKRRASPILLVVAEIHSNLYVYERLLDAINQSAEQSRMLTSGVEQDPLTRFEKLVQRLNETVAAFAADESAGVSWKRVNLFVMELSGEQVCLTGTGHVMNMFLQRQEDGDTKAFDLFGSLDQPVETDPTKPFASIVCGDFKAGDVLFFGSTNLDRLRGELRLKERLSSLPAVTAALEIKQDLERRNIPDDFLGVVVGCVEVKSPVQAPVAMPVENAPPGSVASIEKFIDTQKDTDEHLATSPTPVRDLAAGGAIAKRLMDALMERLRTLLRRPPRNEKDAVAMVGLRGMNAGYGSMFTKQRKLLITIAVALVVLGVAGFFFWKHAQTVAVQNAAWNNALAQAADNASRAESDLVYGNEAQAKTELDTADHAIATLPADTAERKQKVSQLQATIADLRQRLRHVVNEDSAPVLLTLDPSTPAGSLAAPVLTPDDAYAVDNSTGEIVKVDMGGTHTVTRIALPAGVGRVVSGMLGAGQVLFATADERLYALDTSTDLVKKIPWNADHSSSTADVALYTGKLYALDPNASQVWRSVGSSGSYGGQTGYIKASQTPLSNAVALSIDSNVYVLNDKGQVTQFYAGGQVGFSLATIDPPLQSGAGLWTDVDVPDLIVTDPAGKRVLEFDKTGALKAQITSSEFTGPKDVAGDYANKRLVVLDGNQLIEVPMP